MHCHVAWHEYLASAYRHVYVGKRSGSSGDKSAGLDAAAHHSEKRD